MHRIEIKGRVLPLPVAGHPALELCNTWAGWNSPPGTGGDYLRDYATLVVWAEHHRLVTADEADRCLAQADRDRGGGEEVLERTRRLREDLYAVAVHGDRGRALAGLAEVAEEAQSAQRLLRGANGAVTWGFGPGSGLRLPLLAAARAAADLVTSGRLDEVGACPGDVCGWVFLDPRHRRRWCQMATCGNRAKVRAHAERRARG